jgi:hypothetical protein
MKYEHVTLVPGQKSVPLPTSGARMSPRFVVVQRETERQGERECVCLCFVTARHHNIRYCNSFEHLKTEMNLNNM